MTVQAGDRHEVDLGIAARRRTRVLLLGLPGSGKTTALKHLAARWAFNEDAPLPVAVNLKDLRRLIPLAHPVDALIELALLGVRSADRPLLGEELRDRCRDGRLALLLDGLDECREARFTVVQAVGRVLGELSRDVTVILASRDSGYSAASTLPLHPLRLKPFRTPEYTLRQILRAFAAKRPPGGPSATDWITEKLGWIRGALDRDRALAETPLGGILLAVLAAEPRRREFPKGRARTLSAIVDAIVDTWELSQRQRAGDLRLGGLERAQAAAALKGSYAQIGHALLASPPKSASGVKRSLEPWLRGHWGLSAGAAEVTAHEIFSFWDEAGIFIASEESEDVSARLELLAEIGAARYVAELPIHAMRAHLEELAADETKYEVASLAAGLSAEASAAAVSIWIDRKSLKWDLIAAKHLREGANVRESAVRVAQALASDAQHGTDRERWQAAKTVAVLPIPQELKGELLQAFEPWLSADHNRLANAIASAAEELSIQEPDAVLRAAASLLRPRSMRTE
jgi:hypothetical protein